MHPVITSEILATRRADLLREAQHARLVAAARRTGKVGPVRWRRRLGARLVRAGEALQGCAPRPVALSRSGRSAS